MQNRPEEAFRCGPMALDRIRASIRAADAFDDKIRFSRSTTNGVSLPDVCALANDLGMNYQMAKRQPGAQAILPAVVHWRVGHYAALVKEQGGLFLVQDPTFGDDIWVSQAALDSEASGYFLIPAGTLPAGWQPVDKDEGQAVLGKGNTGSSDPNRTRPDDDKTCGGQGNLPMAQYSMHAMVVSLSIMDTPVGYAPPRGPAVRFTVTYNQREANQPSIFTYSNLGNKWTFDWLTYITDDPANPLANANYYVAGGGTEPYSKQRDQTLLWAGRANLGCELFFHPRSSRQRPRDD